VDHDFVFSLLVACRLASTEPHWICSLKTSLNVRVASFASGQRGDAPNIGRGQARDFSTAMGNLVLENIEAYLDGREQQAAGVSLSSGTGGSRLRSEPAAAAMRRMFDAALAVTDPLVLMRPI